MNKYEILYIVNNELSDEVKADVCTKFSDLVESLKGKVINVDKWGTRKFSYPIDYKTEGYYVIMNFEAEPSVPAEIERQMRNADTIIRYMILRK